MKTYTSLCDVIRESANVEQNFIDCFEMEGICIITKSCTRLIVRDIKLCNGIKFLDLVASYSRIKMAEISSLYNNGFSDITDMLCLRVSETRLM